MGVKSHQGCIKYFPISMEYSPLAMVTPSFIVCRRFDSSLCKQLNERLPPTCLICIDVIIYAVHSMLASNF